MKPSRIFLCALLVFLSLDPTFARVNTPSRPAPISLSTGSAPTHEEVHGGSPASSPDMSRGVSKMMHEDGGNFKMGGVYTNLNAVLATLVLSHILLLFLLLRGVAADIQKTKWACGNTFVVRGYTTHNIGWTISHDALPPTVGFSGIVKPFYMAEAEKTRKKYIELQDQPQGEDDSPYLYGVEVSEVIERSFQFDWDQLEEGDFLVAANCRTLVHIDMQTKIPVVSRRMSLEYEKLVKARPFSLQIVRPIREEDPNERDRIFKEQYDKLRGDVSTNYRSSFLTSYTFLWSSFWLCVFLTTVSFFLVFPPTGPYKHQDYSVVFYLCALVLLCMVCFAVQMTLSRKARFETRMGKNFMFPILLIMFGITVTFGSGLFWYGRKADTRQLQFGTTQFSNGWVFFQFSLSVVFLALTVYQKMAESSAVNGPLPIDHSTNDIVMGIITMVDSGFELFVAGRRALAIEGSCSVGELQRYVDTLIPAAVEKVVDCSDVQATDTSGVAAVSDGLMCNVYCGDQPRSVTCYDYGIVGARWHIVHQDSKKFCCSPCMADQYVVTECSREQDRVCATCHECPAGTSISRACTGTGQLDDKQCEDCPAGYYQDLANQTDCKKCPDGEISNTDRTACVTP